MLKVLCLYWLGPIQFVLSTEACVLLSLPFKSAVDPSLGEQPAASNISKAAKAFLRVFDAAAAEFLCPV
jgi:hypothetical protein